MQIIVIFWYHMEYGITLAEFYDLLQILPPSRPVLLVGDTGIGKTSIVRYVAEHTLKMAMSYIPCMESTDMVDITGMMDTTGDHTVYKPPEWYHEGTDCVVLMDEVNRNKAVMKGLMRLASDRKVGSASLTDNSYIFAAINPDVSGVYQVYEMDPAMVARFQVVYIKPTAPEWCEVSEREGVHPSVIGYVRSHPDDLDPMDNADNVARAKEVAYHNVLSSRRGWWGLSDMIKRGEQFSTRDGKTVNRFDPAIFNDARNFLGNIVCGAVGTGVADRFVQFYYSSIGDSMPTPEELLGGSADDWKTKYCKVVSNLCQKDPIAASELAASLCSYLASVERSLWNSSMTAPSLKASTYSKNLYRFMVSCSAEVQSSMYFNNIETVDLKKVKWPKLLGTAYSGLPDYLEQRFARGRKHG